MYPIFAELDIPVAELYTVYMNEADFDKEFIIPEKTINDIIREIKETNGELLERLGSDYDENGKAYWE